MPESDGPVTCTSHKSRQPFFFLQALTLWCICKTNTATLIKPLYIMNRPIVRQECADHLNLLSVLDIPQKDHLVAVHRNDPVPLLISYDRQHI